MGQVLSAPHDVLGLETWIQEDSVLELGHNLCVCVFVYCVYLFFATTTASGVTDSGHSGQAFLWGNGGLKAKEVGLWSGGCFFWTN